MELWFRVPALAGVVPALAGDVDEACPFTRSYGQSGRRLRV